MKIIVSTQSPAKLKGKLLVIPSYSKKEKVQFSVQAKTIDNKLNGLLSELAEDEGFTGGAGETLLIHSHKKVAADRILILGMGDVKEIDQYSIRKAYCAAAKLASSRRHTTLVVTLPEHTAKNLNQAVQATIEGLILGSYNFLNYKGEKERSKQKSVEGLILSVDKKEEKEATKAVQIAQIFSNATIFARDLVNEPSSKTTPTHLAKVALDLEKDNKIEVTVLDEKQMKELGMGCILGVSKGSDEPPRLIKLVYRGGKKKVAFVGKGITFDTGGLSLKQPESMETMKIDMSGAAAILGIFSVISKLKPKATVIGIIPASENMPSGKAIKPGDILKAYNGKTVEVLNTDAEGRLVLADAISWVVKTEKPNTLIDFATLTGACMVALGEEVAGLFSNHKELAEQIKKAALNSAEPIWEMPLTKEYKQLLQSYIADLANVSKTRYGGAITGALFIQEFVGNTNWAHLDIAGPAWAEKPFDFGPKGGAGFGVRLALKYLTDLK